MDALRPMPQGVHPADAYLRMMVDQTMDALFLFDEDGIIIDVNRQAYESLGCRREDLIGTRSCDFDVGVRACAETQRQLRDAVAAGSMTTFESRHRRSDGSEFPVEVRLRPFEESGRRYRVALARDITDRKRAEDELHASQQRLALVVEATSEGIWDWNIPTGEVYYSPRWIESLGYDPGEVDPHVDFWKKIVHPDDMQRTWESLEAHWRGETAVNECENRLRMKNGEYRWNLDRGKVVAWDADGRPVRMVGTDTDISERKRVRDALTLFRSLIDHANDYIEVIDPETGRFLDVNETALRDHGFARDEYLSLTVRDIDPIVGAIPWESTRDRIRNCSQLTIESQHRRKDGSVFEVEVNCVLVRLDREYIVAIVRDITERRRTELRLRQSEERHRMLVENSIQGIALLQDSIVRYANPRFAEIFGYGRPEELVGKSRDILVAPGYLSTLNQRAEHCLKEGATTSLHEWRGIRKDGKEIILESGAIRSQWEGTPALLSYLLDVTDRREMEEQLRQSHKMEAIGQLAGGIAHDFNNLLTVINGYCDLALEQRANEADYRQFFVIIADAGKRAANLTRQLLTFSRKEPVQTSLVQVNDVIHGLLELLQRLIGSHIELRIEPGSSRLTHLDPGQFELAVINLTVNARDAMPRGGVIAIATRDITVRNEQHRSAGSEAGRFECATSGRDVKSTEAQPSDALPPPGSYVCVSITDCGAGMDEETRRRIFEPFFTTKERGRGTGLGLAMVYAFVQQTGGHIRVVSKPEAGTTMLMYLPAAQQAKATNSASDAKGQRVHGSETILLVEDEEPIRKLARSILHSSGYQVLEAADGPSAVEIARNHDGPIDLLVSDILMPGMTGPQLAHLLVNELPHLKVLFVSGYSDETLQRDGILEARSTLLPKPFSPSELVKKVRTILDSPSRPPG